MDVSSVALIKLARERGALYLDTCIEPWAGGYTDPNMPVEARSNYAMRLEALAPCATGQRESRRPPCSRMAPIRAWSRTWSNRRCSNIAKDTGVEAGIPQSRDGWAELAQTLGIKVIHVAERDTQVSNVPKQPNEFVNTWSVDGFVSEGAQPAELGWGTHEKHFPVDGGRHKRGLAAAPSI